MKTVRQKIIALLSERPLDILTLAQVLDIREREVVDHLPHVVRTVTAHGGKLIVREAQCEACGYRFKERKRLSPPTRCPRCKQSRIVGPWYEVSGINTTSAEREYRQGQGRPE